MGWSKIDKSLLPEGLSEKLDEMSDRGWWKQCFGEVNIADLVTGELKGKLEDSPRLKALVAWIDGDESAIGGNLAKTVAGALEELCKELRSS